MEHRNKEEAPVLLLPDSVLVVVAVFVVPDLGGEGRGEAGVPVRVAARQLPVPRVLPPRLQGEERAAEERASRHQAKEGGR